MGQMRPLTRRFSVSLFTCLLSTQTLISFEGTVEISPITFHIDYSPKSVDFKGLSAGKYVELLHVFALDDVELRLEPVRLSAVILALSNISKISAHQFESIDQRMAQAWRYARVKVAPSSL